MKREMNKFLLLCLTFVFLIGVVSAWSVSITNPINESYFGSKPSQFSWTYSGIDLNNLSSNLEYNVNGNINYGLTSNSNQAIGSSQVVQGWNSIILSVTNISGQTENATLDFWVDSINPLITLLNPLTNPSYTNQNFFTITALLTELNIKQYNTKDMKIETLEPSWTSPAVNYFNSNTPFNYPPSGNLDEEGSHTYTIYARDKYPDGITIREINKTGVIIRDITAPTITDDYLSDGVWVNTNQIVTLTPSDLLSYIGDVKYCEGIACDPNTGTLLLSPYSLNYNSDQDTIVRYQVWDLATNPSAIGTYNVRLDKTAPVTTNNYLFNGSWVNADQIITLSPTDALSGIADTLYQIDGFGFSSGTLISVNTEGIHSVDYYSTDNAGNIETTNSISVMIDKSLPVSLITSPATSSWQNADFNVARSDSDAYSGINFCEVQILDNGLPSLLWTATPCNTDYLIDTTSECTTEGLNMCEVQIRSTDNVAWVSAIDSRTFGIDITPPVVDAGLDILTNSPISQDATTSDAASGIATWSWTQIAGPGIITFGTPTTEDTTISADADGIYTLRLTATDNAGNSAFDEISFTWDTTAPVLDLTSPLTNTKVNGDEIISFTDSELTSPQCSVDNINWIPCISGTTILNNIPEFAILSEGAFTLYLKDTDLAGNTGTNNEIGIIKDTISPNVIISSLESDPTNANPISATATFGEDVTGFDILDLVIGNGVANNFIAINAQTYTFDITPIIDGLVTVDIAGGIAQDLAGNLNNPATQFSITYDGTNPVILNFQAVPSVSISQNNPTTITAVDVSDANLDFTGLMFVDSNNLITSSNQILFSANMNDTPISGAYGPINWNANYFKITDGTINEPVSVFVTDFAPTEYIVTGYFQEDPAIPTPLEDCMLGFDMTTNELTPTSYCAGTRIDGVSKFTISSLKFTNGIFSPPSEVNGSTFTLYTIPNSANPYLESALAPSGDYTLILRAEDSAGNDAGEMLTISVDNTAPIITDYLIEVQGLMPTTNNVVYISPQNSLSIQDGLNLNITANEIVDWTIRIQNPDGSLATSSQWITSNSINTKKPVSCNFWNGTLNQCSNVGYLSEGTYTINITLIDNANNLFTDFSKSIIVDNTLPTLSSISATSISSSSASIIWTTDENANSNVSYGTTIPTTSNTGSTTQLISHSISLSSLSASTLYYYNVSSCDAAGNCATSTQYNFTTSAQDDGGNGGGGGGGGGGGSSSIKYYECSEWTDWPACSNNLQTRTCLKKITTTSQKGVIESKFNETETRACTSPALIPLAGSVVEETNEVSGEPTEEATPGFIGRITGGITGAVTGLTKSKGGKISLIVIAVLALAWLLLAYKRKINRQKQERRIRIIHKGGLGKK